MKKIIISSAAVLLSVFSMVLTSCSDDKEDKVGNAPVVKLEEVGHKNSKEAVAGGDMHLEGNIFAENLIQRIDVTIAQEGGSFVISKSFTGDEFVGKKNAKFHKHIDIPANAPVGRYTMTFIVKDKANLSTTVKETITVKVKDNEAPKIKIQEVGHDNSMTASPGKKMHLSAHITAANKIQKIVVEIHKEGTDYEKEFEFAGDYVGLTDASFHEYPMIPADAPKGEYHLHFTVKDANGVSTTVEVEGLQVK